MIKLFLIVLICVVSIWFFSWILKVVSWIMNLGGAKKKARAALKLPPEAMSQLREIARQYAPMGADDRMLKERVNSYLDFFVDLKTIGIKKAYMPQSHQTYKELEKFINENGDRYGLHRNAIDSALLTGHLSEFIDKNFRDSHDYYTKRK